MNACFEVSKISYEIQNALRYFERERNGFEKSVLKVLPEIKISEDKIIVPVISNNKRIEITISVNETV